MSILPVGLHAQSTGVVTTTANGAMGKSDFLNLLITQMKYQDPLDPMTDSEFVAQMAQFSSLEQLLNMSESFASLQSLAYIGRTVKAYTADGGVLSGTVKAVDFTTDMPIMKLDDGSIVAMKDIFEVVF